MSGAIRVLMGGGMVVVVVVVVVMGIDDGVLVVGMGVVVVVVVELGEVKEIISLMKYLFLVDGELLVVVLLVVVLKVVVAMVKAKGAVGMSVLEVVEEE